MVIYSSLAVMIRRVLVSFVMIAYDQKSGIQQGSTCYFAFMIDKRFQGLGPNRLWMQSLTLFEQNQLEKQQVFGLMNQKIIKRDLAISIMDLKETGEVIENEIVAIYDLAATKN